ncbi:hypothetical protein FDP41_002604 [Naegleria fowleri]|uniref:Actin-related protein 2/3 complex subunit 5 n=1 Tax=Naegleria fowleri TaxID=5763 RepID=A0A6A5BYS8_NAEFO|nr:uncharacterized protein FDP41_002604 [Naegleria fowleri]KAF0978089.1 hypothetical protein FDP41_002604 [Naegleria fowleri]CAG4715143.1 unnamed protein product [Naegleria fowleri]
MSDDSEFLKQIQERDSAVKSLVSSQKYTDALKKALENPPLAAKNKETKKKSADVVATVLLNTKESDIQKSVDALDIEELDILMKYIYRCLESGELDSKPLFKWHEKVLEKSGMGSIVRVLTERRNL